MTHFKRTCPCCGRRVSRLIARPTVTRCWTCDIVATAQRSPQAPALYYAVGDSGRPDPHGTTATGSALMFEGNRVDGARKGFRRQPGTLPA